MRIPFLKGHGTENDFVIVPDPDNALDLTPAAVADPDITPSAAETAQTSLRIPTPPHVRKCPECAGKAAACASAPASLLRSRSSRAQARNAAVEG